MEILMLFIFGIIGLLVFNASKRKAPPPNARPSVQYAPQTFDTGNGEYVSPEGQGWEGAALPREGQEYGFEAYNPLSQADTQAMDPPVPEQVDLRAKKPLRAVAAPTVEKQVFEHNDLVKGVIFSEILAKPKALRQGNRR